ncbi:mitochondrial sodium/calcium exchanger protein-like isoform X1 [Salvelinus namaycush]|uniref:Mitochondrial sodium/calcium exchanger protein-like isoform X1 n=1 Tax=Salvelinus namaycush TaxID=8040 RepID=A0A8U1F4N6_SALNM|nr:mitochondrial sodium/calcium exchanger protein-like isoform X1 [Salvelinus namaycush]XP_038869526.1 mitochondrial sodium/calcium exchanger protein-like isoform X1 [Salvelinus namaycush]
MKSLVVFISMLLLLCFQCIYGLGSGESGTGVVPSPDRSPDGADLRSSVGTMVGTHFAMFHQGNTDKCAIVMNLSAVDRCAFVKTTQDCSMEDSFINYLKMTFCLLPPDLTPLTITLCIIWLLFLFIVLGLTASKFFCPNLSAISSTLRLTHNVAGVTFLALGNGAPDVFSATVAFSRPHTAGLAIGALFGAGIFVTTVVAGAVSLVKPFTVASRPFLRDVIFYMAAVFWTVVILYRGTISLGETLGYLGLYVVYVITVITSAYIYSHQKHSATRSSIQSSTHVPEFQSSESDDEAILISNSSIQEDYDSEYCPLLPYCESTSSILLSSLNPVDSRIWRRKSWRWRAIKILKMPLEVLLLLTVPVVDPDKEDRNWRRPLNCLHLITAPLVCVLTFRSGEYGMYRIEDQFPVWALTLLFGLFLSAIVFLTTTNNHPPPYHSLFSLLGFVVSAIWISAAALEVVSILHMLGVVFSLSNNLLGLTLLAWGNSIGDSFSDVTIARQGYPQMAISACFGGIIFNMLIGVGIGCLMQMFNNEPVVTFPHDWTGITLFPPTPQFEPAGLLTWVLAGSLGLSLVLSFILVPLRCFHMGRSHGIFLLLFYTVFLLVALLTEFGFIHT